MEGKENDTDNYFVYLFIVFDPQYHIGDFFTPVYTKPVHIIIPYMCTHLRSNANYLLPRQSSSPVS